MIKRPGYSRSGKESKGTMQQEVVNVLRKSGEKLTFDEIISRLSRKPTGNPSSMSSFKQGIVKKYKNEILNRQRRKGSSAYEYYYPDEKIYGTGVFDSDSFSPRLFSKKAYGFLDVSKMSITPSYKIHLKKLDVDTDEDTYKEGQLPGGGNSWDEDIDKEFDRPDELFEYLNEQYSKPISRDNWNITKRADNIYLCTNTLLNAENEMPTKTEIGKWKKGKERLWNANYEFEIDVVVDRMGIEQVAGLLGITEWEDYDDMIFK